VAVVVVLAVVWVVVRVELWPEVLSPAAMLVPPQQAA
jgi:hypothetical protein